MKIYSTRHGQTEYNRNDIILGTTDIPLNETGITQAKSLAEKIYKINDVDLIISSPMLRAFTTASMVAEKCGLEIITDDRIREWNYGTYEGKSRFTEGFEKNKREFAVKMHGGGESLLQLCHRVYGFLDEIIEKYENNNILVVSHGGICRAIQTYFYDMTIEEYSNWFMGNCEIIEYEVQR